MPTASARFSRNRSGLYGRNAVAILARASLAVISLFLLAQFTGALEKPKDRWTAFMMGVPAEVELKRSVETAINYVLKQTHEPLFRKDDGENYSSRILAEWSRDLPKKKYRFCPDQTRQFSPRKDFDISFFSGYISGTTGKYRKDFELTHDKDCVQIKFSSPEPGFLDFLSRHENSPSVRDENGAEVGLGPFQISSAKKDELRLIRKNKVPDGYNEIIIKEFRGVSDPEYRESRASDYNNVPVYYQPQWREREYQGVDTVDLQVNGIVINISDRELRKRAYNCLDVDRFRRAFFPDRKEFLDISTILPVGMPGARPGKPVQVCPEAKLNRPKPLVLLNHIKGNDAQLAAITEKFRSRTGIGIKVVKCTPGELVQALQATPRDYDLIVVGVGSMQNEYSVLFNYFVNDNGFYDFRIPRIGQLHQNLVHAKDNVSASAFAAEIASEMENAEVFLPLHQSTRKLYYPKGIKNLVIGRGFVQYPEIADFRW